MWLFIIISVDLYMEIVVGNLRVIRGEEVFF